MIPSKDQYQCRVHAAVRAEEDAGPWQGVSVLDGRVDVGVGADGDGVRGVLVLVLVLLVPVSVQVWEGSRFAFLGVELGVREWLVVSVGTRRVLGRKSRLRLGELLRTEEVRMARLVLRVPLLELERRLRRCRTRRLWAVGNRSALFKARCMSSRAMSWSRRMTRKATPRLTRTGIC